MDKKHYWARRACKVKAIDRLIKRADSLQESFDKYKLGVGQKKVLPSITREEKYQLEIDRARSKARSLAKELFVYDQKFRPKKS